MSRRPRNRATRSKRVAIIAIRTRLLISILPAPSPSATDMVRVAIDALTQVFAQNGAGSVKKPTRDL